MRAGATPLLYVRTLMTRYTRHEQPQKVELMPALLLDL